MSPMALMTARLWFKLQKVFDYRLDYLDPCASILIFSSNNQHPITAVDAIHEMDGDHQSVEWVMVAQIVAQEVTRTCSKTFCDNEPGLCSVKSVAFLVKQVPLKVFLIVPAMSIGSPAISHGTQYGLGFLTGRHGFNIGRNVTSNTHEWISIYTTLIKDTIHPIFPFTLCSACI